MSEFLKLSSIDDKIIRIRKEDVKRYSTYKYYEIPKYIGFEKLNPKWDEDKYIPCVNIELRKDTFFNSYFTNTIEDIDKQMDE